MPKVTFLPMGKTVEASEGETLLDVALTHEIPIMHACGGFCSCTTCQVYVQGGAEGMKALSPMEEDETDRIEYADERRENSRLACQTRVQGDVQVEIVNLDE